MEQIHRAEQPNNEAIWIAPFFGIELKITVSERSISALKRFIEVLEYNPNDNLSLDDYTILADTLSSMGNNIVIYRKQYHINIFTTIEELRRMKSLPEMTVKLTLQEYEKRTYPNKAVVLRHFLRDLKDVNELNIEIAPKPHKPIPTFSKMSDLDKIQK